MLRLFTNLILGALYFTKARVITWIDAFLPASHTLVACGKLLTRILLPAIKRLLLFLSGKVIVFQYIIGRGVKSRGMFNFVPLEFLHINHDGLLTTKVINEDSTWILGNKFLPRIVRSTLIDRVAA